MKKALMFLLAMTLILTLALPVFSADPYKIAIMTGALSYSEEEYRAAEKLKEEYPDIVLTDTYPDGFAEETKTTIGKLLAFASDPQVKAIIMCPAIEGTTAAFAQIKNDLKRDDILLIAGAPTEDPQSITSVADIVMDVDKINDISQVVERAKEWGAEVLLYYYFPRHEDDTIADFQNIMKEEADLDGIKIVNRDVPYFKGDASKVGGQNFVMEDIPKVMQKYIGKKVAFSFINCTMEDAIKASQVVKENNQIDTLSIWESPSYIYMIKGSFEYAENYINGLITNRSDGVSLIKLMETVTGSEVGLSNYEDGDGKVYSNYFMLLFDKIDLTDFLE